MLLVLHTGRNRHNGTAGCHLLGRVIGGCVDNGFWGVEAVVFVVVLTDHRILSAMSHRVMSCFAESAKENGRATQEDKAEDATYNYSNY